MIQGFWGRSALASSAAAVVLVGCAQAPAGSAASPASRAAAVAARSVTTACPIAPVPAASSTGVVSMVSIDWIDVVQFGGRQYAQGLSAGPTTIDPAKVGPLLGKTRCHIADSSAGPHFNFRDGDATFLPVGSEVHLIRGVPVTKAVAVYRSGHWLYYKAA